MPIDLYPSVAKVKRNGVYENLPGFIPQTGDESAQAMIAIKESSATAQYVHLKNSYFILNDTLYQADTNIAVGDVIAVETNCHVAVLSEDVTNLQNEITSLDENLVIRDNMVTCELVHIEASDNKCDMSKIIPRKNINWYTGAISDDTNTCLYYMDVQPNDVLYFWTLNNFMNIVSMQGMGFSTYDINGNHTRQGSGTYNHEYTVPENVYGLYIVLNQNWLNTGYKFIIYVNDSTQPTSYEPYAFEHDEYYAKNKFLERATLIGEKEFEITQFPNNKVINYTGGIEDNNNFLITDYIEVFPNDVINASAYSYVDTNNLRTCIISFFDEKFTFLVGYYSTGNSGLITEENITVPNGAKYVVFGKHTSLSYAASYAKIIRKYANIVIDKIPTPEKILPVLPNTKNINILGDSISQGEVATDRPNNSYAGILRQFFSLEYGNKLNYGFVSMSREKDMVYLTNYAGWVETTGSTTAIGGDEYATTTPDSQLTFRIGKEFNYVKIATKFNSSYGTLTLAQGETVFGTVDCSVGSGAGLSEAFDISDADFTQPFTITASSAGSVSGLVLIDDADYWTFNNYGRSGAAPSVFTGATFDYQINGDIVIYALGVNGTATGLVDSLDAIKNRFKDLKASKIVLDLCFKSPQLNNDRKHSLLKKFASETGAKYICIWDYAPKDSNGEYLATGFLNTDGVHPLDAGHQFIAELIAKNIELSVNAKGLAQEVLNSKISWTVD